MTPDERLDALWQKIEEFSARVAKRYPGALACGPGCDDCCHRELTITGIEAERIAGLIDGLEPARREALAERARSGDPCAALQEDGTCAVYEARPVVCRSHGVPIRYEETLPAGRRALPLLDVCPKNFIDHDLLALDRHFVLDQHMLSVLLGGIDALWSREAEMPEGKRYALRDVILAAVS